MTTIIDGVDVSRCEFFETKAQVMQCHMGALTQRCKANNCYYKQLERLKEHHHKTECEASENLKKLVKLEQEREQQKAELELFKTSNQTTIVQLKAELQKYKDNEQQEKEIKKLYTKFEGSSLIEKRSPYEN